MQDKRLTVRLIDYWNRLRNEAMLPQWEQLNISELGDIWQQCCGWRVDGGKSETFMYTYEYVGSSVKEAIGTDLTGKMINSHFQGIPGARIIRNIDDVVKRLVPVVEEGQFINESSKVIKFRSCLLPFGNKQGNVTHIVLGLSWKAF